MDRTFVDLLTGDFISEETIFYRFLELKKTGDTECENFGQYVREITGKNGEYELLDDFLKDLEGA